MAARAGTPRRRYDMAGRGHAVEQSRAAMVAAVHRLLNAPPGGRLTLDEIARASGVTRATVYNRFGSRRALLTAAFADQGRLVQYDRVSTAAQHPDPMTAVTSALREACRAWERLPMAITRVLALAALDEEIGQVAARFERQRRLQMAALARRLHAPAGPRDAASLLAVFTHPLTYGQFRLDASPAVATRRLVAAALSALGLDSVSASRAPTPSHRTPPTAAPHGSPSHARRPPRAHRR